MRSKCYPIQFFIASIFLIFTTSFTFYVGTIVGLAHKIFATLSPFLSMIIFNGVALIIQISAIANSIEYLNFIQKKNIIKSIIKQARNRTLMIEELKEYFSYQKAYFDSSANIKYDIDKQLNFLDSHYQ
jgi:hypothetical protein